MAREGKCANRKSIPSGWWSRTGWSISIVTVTIRRSWTVPPGLCIGTSGQCGSEAWLLYPEKTEYYDAVKAFADNSTSPDGSVILNAKGKPALRPSNIDDLPAGNVFFTLYKEELKKGNVQDAERYKNAASLIRNKLKYEHSRIAEGLPERAASSIRRFIPTRCGLTVFIWVYDLCPVATCIRKGASRGQCTELVRHSLAVQDHQPVYVRRGQAVELSCVVGHSRG